MAFVTQTFNFTGDWKKWKVPNNVKNVTLTVIGGSSDGLGGKVIGDFKVKDTDVLFLAVGRQGFGGSGKNGGNSCFPNGGHGGDGGSAGHAGGSGGGGASIVRLNSQNGDIVAVAGGGGGGSGDGGNGGAGGKRGGNGTRAGGGSNVATGGGAVHGGDGGRVGSNHNFDGEDAGDTKLGRAGKGGTAANNAAYGGGGGGGGYHSGGGGQAGREGGWGGGGGGGGANFVDPLHNVDQNSTASSGGHGSITIGWWEGGDLPPSAPTSVKVNGATPSDDMPLRTQSVTITGVPDDPTKDQKVRMLVLLSKTAAFFAPGTTEDLAPYRQVGTWDEQNLRDSVTFNLDANTKYWGKVYSQDHRGNRSNSYVGLQFWTNRPANPPTLTGPATDTDFEITDTIPFSWTNSDPDADGSHPETPTAHQFRWRRAGTPFAPASAWTTFVLGATASANYPASTFPFGAPIEWQVAAKDPHGLWGGWSLVRQFNVIPAAVPPIPEAPDNNIAQFTSETTLFEWAFRTLIAGETQTVADLRYRLVGEDDTAWVTVTGDGVVPGTAPEWEFPTESFAENQHYEWQVRTHTSNATTSEWSTSAFFWSIPPPGIQGDDTPLDWTRIRETLGEGNNRVHLYARGGKIYLGEITPLAQVQWNRKRDDIGSCTIQVNQWDEDGLALLRRIKTWATELVVYRESPRGNERAFEGPVVRITDKADSVEIEAKDVMGYVYRRLLRTGYNDMYQILRGRQVGMHTVVYRAQRIIANALAYDDPNVLPYLTALSFWNDAVQTRVVKAYSKSAWDDIDDMAANSGLDYSVAGRRIILNDVHRPIGRLVELSNGHFSTPPIITEYGMSYATDFAVTNNNGSYGIATRGRVPNTQTLTGEAAETGYVEMIASQYGESDVQGTGTDDLTPAQQAALKAVLTDQATRNIANRFPIPRIVRVPDNASLMPDTPVGINQLIPGVWIPLRATGSILEASQWQKLDEMTVLQTEKGEKVTVVMSPAPNAGQDPDAEIDPGELA